MADTGKQTKVFRAEILKPVNYTWAEFNSIVNRATYHSAQLANEVIVKRFLLGKGFIEKGSTFCSMIDKCKDAPVSTNVKCAVCQHARDKYLMLVKKIMRADVSLPTFRNNSLLIRAEGVRFVDMGNNDWVVRLAILPKLRTGQPDVVLRTRRIKEKAKGYYQILERIASKEYKLGFCRLQRDNVRGKLYLSMSYTFDTSKVVDLIPTRVMGVDLGVATPAYCAFNDSVKRLSLFIEGEKLLRVKRQIQSRRRGIAKETIKRDSHKGHGVSGKFCSLQPLESKWVNFRRTWNHTLSSRIVDYAIKEQASTIHIEDLSVDVGVSRFLGKEWPVYELLWMITRKGEASGLVVQKVSPYKTSQVCSRCGTIKEHFTLKDRVAKGMPAFVCDCGFQDNADYNAAKNIAKSTLIVK